MAPDSRGFHLRRRALSPRRPIAPSTSAPPILPVIDPPLIQESFVESFLHPVSAFNLYEDNIALQPSILIKWTAF